MNEQIIKEIRTGIVGIDRLDTISGKYKDLRLMPDYHFKFSSYNEYLYDYIIKSDRVELSETNLREILRDLSKEFWICLLRQHPRLALSLSAKYGIQTIWLSLTVEDWMFAIPYREGFVRNVLEFAKHDLFCKGLLKARPNFLRGKSINGWQKILKYRPEWVIYMDEEKWDDFNKEDFECLLKSDFFTSNKIQSYPEVLCCSFWWNCLLKAPSSVGFCEKNNGWGQLSNYNLCNLMIKQSAVVKYCKNYIKWGQMDSSDWIMLLKGKIEGLNVLDICNEYNAWQMFKCSDWYELLEAQPQFSIYCDKYRGWSLFDDGYWMSLLNKHSQFIEKYRDATKSEETDDEILNKVSSYIAECDWRRKMDRYREYDYSYLPADWAEESGWNDMYGGGCDPSDFIDYD